MRTILIFIAVAYALNGLWLLVDPQLWYDTIPGITMLGPYNTHFLRDVGIVYLVSGAGLWWGLGRGRGAALVIAAAWPALHAIYHFQMWIARGFPFDLVALVNVSLIQTPAWLGLWAAWRFYKQGASGKISL